MEWIGYVFSHVSGSYILGFKGLFLSFFDGSSFFPWDMSLHVEMGRNKKKPQGLSKKEAKKRYSKERDIAKKEIKIVLVKNVKMNALKVRWI